MIRVQREDFDLAAEVARMTEGNHGIGGVCAFVGLVRDVAGDQPIAAMTLEHYPAMTEKALAAIEAEIERTTGFDPDIRHLGITGLCAGCRPPEQGAEQERRAGEEGGA